MAWTERLAITAQQRNAGTFNSQVRNVPAIVDELRFDFNFPNVLPNVASGNLRVQFSLDNGATWSTENLFNWEIEDKIGTVDKNGNTVTENPLVSFEIPVPEVAKNAKMRFRITLLTDQFIGLTVYSQ
jgi:hypothetical protein